MIAALVDDDHPLAHQQSLDSRLPTFCFSSSMAAAAAVLAPFALAPGPLPDHRLERVHGLQQDVQGGLVERQLLAADAVQEVFGVMGQLGDAGELQHRRGTLQGVDGPEDLVQAFGLAGIFLQRQQGLVGHLKVFLGVVQVVAQEHGEVGEVVVRHGSCSLLLRSAARWPGHPGQGHDLVDASQVDRGLRHAEDQAGRGVFGDRAGRPRP